MYWTISILRFVFMIKSFIYPRCYYYFSWEWVSNSISIQFYILAGELTFGDDDLLLEYCELSKNPTDEKLEQFLKNIIQYKFREIPTDNNPLILLANRILEKKRIWLLVKGYFIVWKLWKSKLYKCHKSELFIWTYLNFEVARKSF